jgi:hypothetical protein
MARITVTERRTVVSPTDHIVKVVTVERRIVTVAQGVIAVSGGTTPTNVLSPGVYACPASVAVGDAVFVSGTNTVDRAVSAIAGQTEEAIGIVRSKPSAGSCVVVPVGEVSGYAGLSVGSFYWLDPSTPGGITATVPALAGQLAQRVGLAVSPSVLWAEIRPAVRL